MRIMVRDVRLAFPSLFKPSAPRGGGEAAFNAAFLLPKDHPQLKEINAALDQVAKDKWGVKAPTILTALRKADKICLHDGDSKGDYDGFSGNFFISARSKVKPTTLNANKEDVLEQDGVLYSGCYVNASFEIWAQDNDFGKRINAQLRGVQFRRKGDAFAGGGQPADTDEFDDISAEEDTTAEVDPLQK
jgi:hypothetical protein